MRIGKIENIVPVVAHGGIAHPDVNDGHIIPVLVVDCTHNSTLIDLCHVHASTPSGDVTSKWTWDLLNKRHVFLTLDFIKPVKTKASIQFDVQKQGGLVCGILTAHAFYLQPSTFGAKVSEGVGKPNILIEVPSNVTLPNWDATFEKQLIKRYKHNGYDKTQAKQAAKQYVQRTKEAWSLRTPRPKQEAQSTEGTKSQYSGD